jgi:hypothetical protein
MVGYELTVSDGSQCPDEEDHTSETMLSFALAVASQIEDQNLKVGLSAGLASSLDAEPTKDLSTSEVIAHACAELDELCHSRRATNEAIARSRTSLTATRMLLRSIAQAL